ncbi:Peptide deformylase [Roseivivax sp. THAF40]|uniref:peptide deformylase n=1 Tax=unclassified Roseivivax TaxID=2639302 RepID=UPI001268CBF3|nr:MULTISPECIES: peptide deformylase [unclassified Roseivivax]QFS84525.1 Peptide deformylase [Roseivivax sp. THAF197b]QFT48353.1 Peptide deformylase [Roseivivax sp. THAF40]
MSIRAILTWPDERLTQACAPVGDAASCDTLVTDLFETMYDAPGRGLAAPQVGVMSRVFVMDAGWKDGEMTPRACIDPEILWSSEELARNDEGCLSIPGITVSVERPARIRLAYTTPGGERIEADLAGAEALIAQHELDHLDGRVTFDRLSPDARSAALSEYSGA